MASRIQQGQSDSPDHGDNAKEAHERKHKLNDQDDGLQDENNSSDSREERSQSPSNKAAKSEGKAVVSPDLRKEQNRAAQRAFRDRKERYLQQLENMVNELREQQQQTTTRFQKEVQQLKTHLDAAVGENYYLREVVFAFETALCKGGHVAVLQDVKLELYRHHYEKSQTNIATDALQSIEGQRSVTSSVKEPPHPLTLSLSDLGSSHEMQFYTANRDILYKAPPLFISVSPEDGKVASVSSPLERLSTRRPSYTPPGTHLPKKTDYTKHPTVFDELQSSLFPPGTLQSLVQSGMPTPQEIVNDDMKLFENSQQNRSGRPAIRGDNGQNIDIMVYASKVGLVNGNHRLQKEFEALISAPPATDPNISPQIYEIPHDPRIDLVPCPKMRAQMILHQNKYDHDELFQLLVEKAVCHGSPLDEHSWELPDEFFDRFGFLIGLDMERVRRKIWPRKVD
ncbi:hypothetical protein BGX21_011045 [Mortierella sp. AD011]|nr:hypothetical protein BGX20_008739 [Mortierella sp. AD010]KAF9392353.1 hypothetical protein BGX21_011045 [Mortierella sp. AD011]